METFQQILELDDDEAHEYSRDLAGAYFAQARTIFADMRKALYVFTLYFWRPTIYQFRDSANKDLKELSSLGHFLKGSSAALGVAKVSSSCQKIEHYGKLRDEKANRDLTREDALTRIGALLGTVGQECTIAEDWLKEWYQKERRP
jgi:osomolarity two-component system phosphorelay intermediate protein YPD1